MKEEFGMAENNLDEILISETERNVPFKNKKIFFVLLLILLLLIAAAVAGFFVFSPNDISGAWELVENPEINVATSDEIPQGERAYYVFEKPDKYGRGSYHICYQGGVEYYEYELLEEDSVKKINLGTEDMEYKITGRKLFGNAKLTIIFPEYTDELTGEKVPSSEYVFEQAKDPSYETQGYNNPKTDKVLLGTWTCNERTLSYYHYIFTYSQTVEIKDNGIILIHYESADLGLDRYMYYAYTTKDSELTFSLVTDKDTKHTVSYDFDEQGNLVFKDDNTTDSVFADEIFGEFTYYSPENLPKDKGASADEMYISE